MHRPWQQIISAKIAFDLDPLLTINYDSARKPRRIKGQGFLVEEISIPDIHQKL